jgi:tetratricopeptide (TPR) repeat protein
MSLPLIILLVGLSYVVLLGGLALFRREGLSLRFAIEAVCITAIVSGLAALTGFPINPVLFLILLYLLTMRVRLLVDLGNVFARQGKNLQAGKLYTLAANLWPDASSKLILMVNQATLLLQENQPDEAIAMFGDVLQQAGQGYLGVKYEAAAHFNLGVAYLRKNLPARATIEFNAVITWWPCSHTAPKKRWIASAPGMTARLKANRPLKK